RSHRPRPARTAPRTGSRRGPPRRRRGTRRTPSRRRSPPRWRRRGGPAPAWSVRAARRAVARAGAHRRRVLAAAVAVGAARAGARTRVGHVEARPLEHDPRGAEDLADLAVAHLAGGQRVVAEGLHDFEPVALIKALVLVRGHQSISWEDRRGTRQRYTARSVTTASTRRS